MKKFKNKKILILGITSFVIIVSFLTMTSAFDEHTERYSVFGYNAEETLPKSSFPHLFNTSNWMSNIADDVYPSTLSIPGTHDSAAHRMKESGLGIFPQTKAKTLTQSINITRQLQGGVRYLDIRAKIRDNKFGMYHGDFWLETFFHDVLDEINVFLNDNPSEIIFMRLKNEGGDPQDKFENMLLNLYYDNPKYKHLFYRERATYDTKLGELRGKIVFFRNFNANYLFGGYSYPAQSIQDDYQVNNSDTGLHTKALKVVEHLKEANDVGNMRREFFINHLSGTGTSSLDSMFPWYVASGFTDKKSNVYRDTNGNFNLWPVINGQRKVIGTNIVASEQIKKNRWFNVGIVVADYPGTELLNTVINANFFKYDKDANYVIHYEVPSGAWQYPEMSLHKKRTKTTISNIVPRMTGYEFVKWDYKFGYDYEYTVSKASFKPGDSFEVIENAVLEANWVARNERFNVVYTSDQFAGSEVTDMPSSVTNIKYDELYTISLTKPKRKDYSFEGWEYGGKTYQPGDTIAVNNQIKLKAKWKFAGYSINYLTLPGQKNTPIDNTQYTGNEQARISCQIPTLYGETFSHWLDIDTNVTWNPCQNFTMQSRSMTLKPVFNTNYYTLTYISNGGATNMPVDNKLYTTDEDAWLSLQIPILRGHTFIGWRYILGDNIYPPGTHVGFFGKDLVFIAVWKQNDYTLKYTGDSNVSNIPNGSQTYHYKDNVTLSKQIPSRKGYTFKGWKYKDKLYQAGSIFSMDDADVVLVAEMEMNKYKIKYKMGPNESNMPIDNNLYIEDEVAKISNTIPSKKGYKFLGWEYNGKRYLPGSSIKIRDTDIEMKAQWIKDNGLSTSLDTPAENAPGMWIYIGD